MGKRRLLKLTIAATRNRVGRESGMTLIEVMTALAILGLISTSLLGYFSTAGMWLANGSKRTRAHEYAVSIIETLKAHSGELDLNELESMPQYWDLGSDCSFATRDNDPEDQIFQVKFKHNQPAALIKASPGMMAVISLSQHQDTSYYDADRDGLEDFPRCLHHNLFNVVVTVNWSTVKGTERLVLSTIMGAR